MQSTLINKLRFFTALLLFSIISSCSTSPEFTTTQVDKTLTPQRVIAEPDNSLNKIALWGGTILDTRNLENSTQIEILGYPLDSSHRPLLDKKPLGRFIVLHSGYLEPATYSQGELLSVLGSIGANQKGKIGEKLYTYPVIKAEKLHLWSASDGRSNTRFHIGIGIRL